MKIKRKMKKKNKGKRNSIKICVAYIYYIYLYKYFEKKKLFLINQHVIVEYFQYYTLAKALAYLNHMILIVQFD